jgi:hypothetical protein
MYETLEEYFKYFKKLPNNPNKSEWIRVYVAMATHTSKRIPTELLLAQRPNEEPDTFKYRVANYRPITYGSMNKALDDVYRILNGVSYTLNGPDNVKQYFKDTNLEEYNNTAQNEICSIDLFLQKIVLKRMIEDPNGFLVWVPDNMVDSATKVQPKPKLVYSEDFIYSDKNVFIYDSCEKTPLTKDDGSVEMSGEKYYIFTPNEYWSLYQVGSLANPTWETVKIYRHGLGKYPVIVLGGDMCSHDIDKKQKSASYYDSYFSPYLAFGDEAIRQFSDWQAIMTTAGFPKAEEFMTECAIEKYSLRSNDPNASEEEFQNNNIGYAKLKPMQRGPYGRILRKVPNSNVADDALDANIPSIRYINPDVEVARYSGESWEKLIDKAEQALNIDMTVGVDQSGKAKLLDKEGQYSMLTKIGNNVFSNIYNNSLRIVDGYLNTTTIQNSKASVNKPSTFWVKNELDLIQEISTLKTNNAPSFFLAEATTDLAKKRFNGNPVNQKMFDFIALYDSLFIYTATEKNSLLASGAITLDDIIISLRMYSVLMQIISDWSPATFIETDMQAIKDEFDTRIAEYIPEPVTPQFDELGNQIN